MPRKTTRIDMHSHTRGSDGLGTPAEIVRYAVESGIHGLCLTDHHASYYDDNQEVHKVAEALREAGLFAVIGCEYSTKQGHLLIFGPRIPKGHFGMYPQMQDVIDWAHEHGGACVVPHPYKGYKYTIGDGLQNIEGLAGIEVLNGQVEQSMPATNSKARTMAEKLGVPMTAGSDAHYPGDIGCVYTEFEGRIRGERKFLEALKAGAFAPKRNDFLLEKRKEERKAKTRSYQLAAAHYTIPAAPDPQGNLPGFWNDYGSAWETDPVEKRERDDLDDLIDKFNAAENEDDETTTEADAYFLSRWHEDNGDTQ